MPDLTQLAVFLAAAFVLAVTPGPGIFYVAARTLAGGRAEGVASSFGTGLGGMAHVVAGSLGVSAVVLAGAELFTALSWSGPPISSGSASARSGPPAAMRRQR